MYENSWTQHGIDISLNVERMYMDAAFTVEGNTVRLGAMSWLILMREAGRTVSRGTAADLASPQSLQARDFQTEGRRHASWPLSGIKTTSTDCSNALLSRSSRPEKSPFTVGRSLEALLRFACFAIRSIRQRDSFSEHVMSCKPGCGR